MTEILMAIGAILIGFLLTIYSAQWFSDAIVSLANIFKIPIFIIALTIVPIGTSAPEIAVSFLAALEGKTTLVYGNIIGSNIVNIAITFAIVGMFFAIPVNKKFSKSKIPVLFAFYLLLGFFLLDYTISSIEGIILLVCFVSLISYLIYSTIKHKAQDEVDASEVEAKYNSSKIATLVFIGSLAVLISGSKLLIWGAISLATIAGVSELLISLTVLAIGTSLPEIMISIVCARQGMYDIVVGNIIGSNFYNIALVLAMSAIINPIHISHVAFWRDYWFSLLILVIMTAFIYFYRNKATQINKAMAFALIVAYSAYTFLLIP